jgi:hypothetical protein
MKKRFPDASMIVHERNRPDDTFGFGVVFSDETLGNFEEADPESYRAIRAGFAYWDDIDTFYAGQGDQHRPRLLPALARALLQILQERARALGVRVHFQREVDRHRAHVAAPTWCRRRRRQQRCATALRGVVPPSSTGASASSRGSARPSR